MTRAGGLKISERPSGFEAEIFDSFDLPKNNVEDHAESDFSDAPPSQSRPYFGRFPSSRLFAQAEQADAETATDAHVMALPTFRQATLKDLEAITANTVKTRIILVVGDAAKRADVQQKIMAGSPEVKVAETLLWLDPSTRFFKLVVLKNPAWNRLVAMGVEPTVTEATTYLRDVADTEFVKMTPRQRRRMPISLSDMSSPHKARRNERLRARLLGGLPREAIIFIPGRIPVDDGKGGVQYKRNAEMLNRFFQEYGEGREFYEVTQDDQETLRALGITLNHQLGLFSETSPRPKLPDTPVGAGGSPDDGEGKDRGATKASSKDDNYDAIRGYMRAARKEHGKFREALARYDAELRGAPLAFWRPAKGKRGKTSLFLPIRFDLEKQRFEFTGPQELIADRDQDLLDLIDETAKRRAAVTAEQKIDSDAMVELAEKASDPRQALLYYRKAIELNPFNIKAYRGAVKAEKNDPDLHLEHARAELVVKNYQERDLFQALTALVEYIRLETRSEKVADLEFALRALKEVAKYYPQTDIEKDVELATKKIEEFKKANAERERLARELEAATQAAAAAMQRVEEAAKPPEPRVRTEDLEARETSAGEGAQGEEVEGGEGAQDAAPEAEDPAAKARADAERLEAERKEAADRERLSDEARAERDAQAQAGRIDAAQAAAEAAAAAAVQSEADVRAAEKKAALEAQRKRADESLKRTQATQVRAKKLVGEIDAIDLDRVMADASAEQEKLIAAAIGMATVYVTETTQATDVERTKKLADDVEGAEKMAQQALVQIEELHRKATLIRNDREVKRAALVQDARNQVREGKIDEAVALYKQALQVLPDDVATYNELAELLDTNKKYLEAKETYDLLVAAAGETPEHAATVKHAQSRIEVLTHILEHIDWIHVLIGKTLEKADSDNIVYILAKDFDPKLHFGSSEGSEGFVVVGSPGGDDFESTQSRLNRLRKDLGFTTPIIWVIDSSVFPAAEELSKKGVKLSRVRIGGSIETYHLRFDGTRWNQRSAEKFGFSGVADGPGLSRLVTEAREPSVLFVVPEREDGFGTEMTDAVRAHFMKQQFSGSVKVGSHTIRHLAISTPSAIQSASADDRLHQAINTRQLPVVLLYTGIGKRREFNVVTDQLGVTLPAIPGDSEVLKERLNSDISFAREKIARGGVAGARAAQVLPLLEAAHGDLTKYLSARGRWEAAQLTLRAEDLEVASPDTAQTLCHQALDIDPSYPPALVTLARLFARQEKWDEVIMILEDPRSQKEDYAGGHFYLGRAYQAKEKIDDALKKFQAYLDHATVKDPKNAVAKASTIAYAKKAIADLKDLQKKKGEEQLAKEIKEHLQKGQNALDAHTFDQAKVEFEAVLQSQKDNAAAQFGLAQALDGLNDIEKALAAYGAFVALKGIDVNSSEYKTASQRIADLEARRAEKQKIEKLVKDHGSKADPSGFVYATSDSFDGFFGADNSALGDAIIIVGNPMMEEAQKLRQRVASDLKDLGESRRLVWVVHTQDFDPTQKLRAVGIGRQNDEDKLKTYDVKHEQNAWRSRPHTFSGILPIATPDDVKTHIVDTPQSTLVIVGMLQSELMDETHERLMGNTQRLRSGLVKNRAGLKVGQKRVDQIAYVERADVAVFDESFGQAVKVGGELPLAFFLEGRRGKKSRNQVNIKDLPGGQ